MKRGHERYPTQQVHRLRIDAGHWIVHVDQVRMDALYQRVDLPRAGHGPVDRLSSAEIRSGERHSAADEARCRIALETEFRDPALSVTDEDDPKTGGHQSAAEEHQVRLRAAIGQRPQEERHCPGRRHGQSSGLGRGGRRAMTS